MAQCDFLLVIYFYTLTFFTKFRARWLPRTTFSKEVLQRSNDFTLRAPWGILYISQRRNTGFYTNRRLSVFSLANHFCLILSASGRDHLNEERWTKPREHKIGSDNFTIYSESTSIKYPWLQTGCSSLQTRTKGSWGKKSTVRRIWEMPDRNERRVAKTDHRYRTGSARVR